VRHLHVVDVVVAQHLLGDLGAKTKNGFGSFCQNDFIYLLSHKKDEVPDRELTQARTDGVRTGIAPGSLTLQVSDFFHPSPQGDKFSGAKIYRCASSQGSSCLRAGGSDAPNGHSRMTRRA
jgi:hypothetical protein